MYVVFLCHHLFRAYFGAILLCGLSPTSTMNHTTDRLNVSDLPSSRITIVQSCPFQVAWRSGTVAFPDLSGFIGTGSHLIRLMDDGYLA